MQSNLEISTHISMNQDYTKTYILYSCFNLWEKVDKLDVGRQ